ncbi:hypothetical protein PN441_11845 [Spirulina major CS-329]|uniref:hypothetical protein n=1 Tax=Spirulina major TaxID=270636 RepID=UPI00232B9D32|nr:hypothetical protein [Spirulina major]MDB9503765.1 hypothetical protein [Spirulina major CS-329]
MMNDAVGTIFGFLGGTIVSCENGYRVLEHPNPKRVYCRLSEAKWFLALRWCEQCAQPAGILNHEAQLAFYNEASLRIGEDNFLPAYHRLALFQECLTLPLGQSFFHSLTQGSQSKIVQVIGLEIDPRFGRVALVRLL